MTAKQLADILFHMKQLKVSNIMSTKVYNSLKRLLMDNPCRANGIIACKVCLAKSIHYASQHKLKYQ